MINVLVWFYRGNELVKEEFNNGKEDLITENISVEIPDAKFMYHHLTSVLSSYKFKNKGHLKIVVSCTCEESYKVLMELDTIVTDDELVITYAKEDGMVEEVAKYPLDYKGPLGFIKLGRNLVVSCLLEGNMIGKVPMPDGQYKYKMGTEMVIPRTHRTVEDTLRHYIERFKRMDIYYTGSHEFSIYAVDVSSGKFVVCTKNILDDSVEVEYTNEIKAIPIAKYANIYNMTAGSPNTIHATNHIHPDILKTFKDSIKITVLDMRRLATYGIHDDNGDIVLGDVAGKSMRNCVPISTSKKQLATNIFEFILRHVGRFHDEEKFGSHIDLRYHRATDIEVDGTRFGIRVHSPEEYDGEGYLLSDKCVLGSIMTTFVRTSPERAEAHIKGLIRKIYIMIHYGYFEV